MRRKMGPQDTFVRGHIRGGDGTPEKLKSRLSKYSLLADALGLAARSTSADDEGA